MQIYLTEYRLKDNDALKRSLRVLTGQPDDKAQQRVRAIKQVMAERMGEAEPADSKAESPNAEPKSFDEIVARKYIQKLENARSRGIEFNLSLSDMRKLMIRKTCHYTGMRLDDDCDPLEPQKRTLDRLKNSEGYTKENTVACSLAANALKNAVFEDPTSLCRMSKSQFRRFASKF